MWQTPTWGVALHMLFPGMGKWIQFFPSFVGLLLAWPLWRRWRRDFEWRKYSPTIILMSVITSSFTWTFDWLVLLPVVIVILTWFQTKFIYRYWLMAGLALVYVATVVQPFIVRNYFYSIWLPPALWLLYYAVTRFRAISDCRNEASRFVY
jgi:hypothetical protein